MKKPRLWSGKNVDFKIRDQILLHKVMYVLYSTSKLIEQIYEKIMIALLGDTLVLKEPLRESTISFGGRECLSK